MTEREWLNVGYDNGIIDVKQCNKVSFGVIYKDWFRMKMNLVKPQSLDRIECTYNRYYLESALSTQCIDEISDNDIIDFVKKIIVQNGNITYKELGRIMQIVTSVINYARDIGTYGVALHDWDKIKRYIPQDKLCKQDRIEEPISDKDIEELLFEVINRHIYFVKQSASLLLCMNFYLGLRVGELASLKFSDFDFNRNIVKIYKTESKFYNRDSSGERIGTMVYRVQEDCKTVYSVRQIPLLPQVKYIYNCIKDHHSRMKYESEYLGFDGDDTILVRSLDRTLRKLCQLCNIPYFNTHKIRKTFATKLHYKNVPSRSISDLLGHSEIGTTENSYILSYNNNYDILLGYMKDGLDYGCDIEKSARRGSNPYKEI